MTIMPAGQVLLGPEALDVGVLRPALKGQGAGFETLDHFIPGQEGS